MKRTWFARIAALALALGVGAGAGIAFSSSNAIEADAAPDGSAGTWFAVTSKSQINTTDKYLLGYDISGVRYYVTGGITSDGADVSTTFNDASMIQFEAATTANRDYRIKVLSVESDNYLSNVSSGKMSLEGIAKSTEWNVGEYGETDKIPYLYNPALSDRFLGRMNANTNARLKTYAFSNLGSASFPFPTLYYYHLVEDSVTAKQSSFDAVLGDTLNLTSCVTAAGPSDLSFSCAENEYFDIDGSTLTPKKVGGPIEVTATKGTASAKFNVSVALPAKSFVLDSSLIPAPGTAYADNIEYTFTGLNDLSGGITGSTAVLLSRAMKNGDNIQMKNGTGAHIVNTSAVPGRITRITASFSAAGKNVSSLYASNGTALTADNFKTAGTKIGDGSIETDTQVFEFPEANLNYFYFDLSEITGTVYFTLKVEYDILLPQITASKTSATIYTNNETSTDFGLEYANFKGTPSLSVVSSNTSVIPQANCAFAADQSKLTVTSNGVAGSSEITVTAEDTDHKTSSVKLTVTVEDNSVALTGIAITTDASKVSYVEGEKLDLTGLVVTATFDDASTNDVTESCVFTPAAETVLSTTNTKVDIAYTFSGVTKYASFDITVAAKARFTLVTDITQIVDGAEILIAAENADKTYAAKAYTSGNNVGAIESQLDDGKLVRELVAEAYVIEVSSNGYAFKDSNDKYLAATGGSSSNKLTAVDTAGDTAYWNIAIDEDGAFSVVNTKEDIRGVMQFNATSTLFNCYASATQTAVKLYVKVAEPTTAQKLATFEKLYMHTEVESTDSGTGLCKDDGWYAAAKEALAGDWKDIQAAFQADQALWARYVAWATANGEVVNYVDDAIVYSSGINGRVRNSDSAAIWIVVVLLAVSAIAVSGMIVMAKKRRAK